MNDTQQQRSALVFGARNLGRGVIERLRADGWAVAAVARSESTLATAEAAGALAMRGDITDPDSIRETLDEDGRGARRGRPGGQRRVAPTAARAAARSAAGRWPRPRRPRSTTGRRRPARAAFTFLSAAARFAVEQARPATLIQVTGGSARRAMPGRGLWAAGAFAVRAITQAAALELREQGIHVALLIVDAGIEPFEGGGREGVDRAALADPREIADAVAFLADQGARAATHELQVTPLAERWVP